MPTNYSVLMSVYHKEKPEFLIDSVRSVMNQTVKTDDFVLIEDGPLTKELDDAVNLLRREFSCLHVFSLSKNMGLGKALSLGLLKTKNNIVMRMDSDDLCMPNRAEIQLKYMDQYDLVGGYITEFEGKPENIIGIRKVPENYENIYKFAKKRNPFNHPTVMFKKDVILKAGNYQTLLYQEDYHLWIRLLKITNKVCNVPEVLVNMRSGREMRARRGNKTARKSIRTLRKFMYHEKMISWFNCVFYTCLYNTFLALPVGIKIFFYSFALRKKNGEKNRQFNIKNLFKSKFFAVCFSFYCLIPIIALFVHFGGGSYKTAGIYDCYENGALVSRITLKANNDIKIEKFSDICNDDDEFKYGKTITNWGYRVSSWYESKDETRYKYLSRECVLLQDDNKKTCAAFFLIGHNLYSSYLVNSKRGGGQKCYIKK